ncbi:MAG: aquaporin [Akkermansiaceae bacterium]
MGASRRELIGEVVGTFILVFFGLGSVALEVATNVSLGLPVIALVWGAAVALAIYVVGPLSGAHINSAMTLAFALWNDFPWRKVPAYVGAQFVGAMLGAMAVYGFFRGAISKFEVTAGIVRGEPGSEASAKIFGEYFGDAPLLKAMIWEGSGTFLLAFGVLWIIAATRHSRLKKWQPVMVGLWLALLIWLVAPVTQAGFNPARDLGPRIVSSLLGWGSWTFEANGWGWLLVYVIAPVIGALLGGGLLSGKVNLLKRGLSVLLGFVLLWFLVVRATSSARRIEIEGPRMQLAYVPSESLRIGAYNIAHGRGYEEGKSNWDGGNPAERWERLESLAAVMKSENLDVIVLNEVDFNASWSYGVDQAAVLADLLDMPYLLRHRTYDTGLPFLSLEFGNAVLTRFPLKDAKFISYPAVKWWEPVLAGQKHGAKVTVEVGEDEFELAAVHLDTRSAEVRQESVQILSELRGRNLILAGDFNSSLSKEGNSAMDYLKKSGRYGAAGGWTDVEGQFLTYPVPAGERRIDWILVPGHWTESSAKMRAVELSDHALCPLLGLIPSD